MDLEKEAWHWSHLNVFLSPWALLWDFVVAPTSISFVPFFSGAITAGFWFEGAWIRFGLGGLEIRWSPLSKMAAPSMDTMDSESISVRRSRPGMGKSLKTESISNAASFREIIFCGPCLWPWSDSPADWFSFGANPSSFMTCCSSKEGVSSLTACLKVLRRMERSVADETSGTMIVKRSSCTDSIAERQEASQEELAANRNVFHITVPSLQISLTSWKMGSSLNLEKSPRMSASLGRDNWTRNVLIIIIHRGSSQPKSQCFQDFLFYNDKFQLWTLHIPNCHVCWPRLLLTHARICVKDHAITLSYFIHCTSIGRTHFLPMYSVLCGFQRPRLAERNNPRARKSWKKKIQCSLWLITKANSCTSNEQRATKLRYCIYISLRPCLGCWFLAFKILLRSIEESLPPIIMNISFSFNKSETNFRLSAVLRAFYY